MADQTTSSTNPIAASATSADDTTVQLPQVDLSETSTNKPSAVVESLSPDNTVSDNTNSNNLPVDKDISPTTEQTNNEQAPVEEDPFAWLNIVFDKKEEGGVVPSENSISSSTSEEASLPTETKTSFVDPFLNPWKKAEETNAVVSMDEVSSDPAISSSNQENQINLDAMLSTVETNTTEVVIAKTGLTDKKKKIIMIGSGLIGLLLLAWTSYFVFTTMFPVETDNLVADISGWKWNTWTTASWTTTDIENSNPDQNAKPEEYKPQAEIINTAKDDELPMRANEFGEEDELPINAPIKEEVPAETTTNTWSTGEVKEDELTDVKPEVSKATEDLNKKIEWAKQLLTLLRTKPNLEQTKTLAGMIKEIKLLLSKLQNNSFTSFSDEIEKPMTDLGFRFDKLTSDIVWN